VGIFQQSWKSKVLFETLKLDGITVKVPDDNALLLSRTMLIMNLVDSMLFVYEQWSFAFPPITTLSFYS